MDKDKELEEVLNFKFSDFKILNSWKRLIVFEVIKTGKDTILVIGFTISEEIDLNWLIK